MMLMMSSDVMLISRYDLVDADEMFNNGNGDDGKYVPHNMLCSCVFLCSGLSIVANVI